MVQYLPSNNPDNPQPLITPSTARVEYPYQAHLLYCGSCGCSRGTRRPSRERYHYSPHQCLLLMRIQTSRKVRKHCGSNSDLRLASPSQQQDGLIANMQHISGGILPERQTRAWDQRKSQIKCKKLHAASHFAPGRKRVCERVVIDVIIDCFFPRTSRDSFDSAR